MCVYGEREREREREGERCIVNLKHALLQEYLQRLRHNYICVCVCVCVNYYASLAEPLHVLNIK